jgi:hypothetical protein
MTPRQILELTEDLFPIAQMAEGLDRAHLLLLDPQGRLNLVVCFQGQYKIVKFESEQDEVDLSALQTCLQGLRNQEGKEKRP